MEHDPTFRTTDIDFAAYLVTQGFKLRGAMPPEPGDRMRHSALLFEASPLVEQEKELWFGGTQPRMVDARAFSTARVRVYRLARETAEFAA